MAGCPVAALLISDLLPLVIVAFLVIIVTPILLLSYCIFRIFRKKKKIVKISSPPSPFQLPIVGCLPFISSDGLHYSFSKWAKKFGKLFSCRIGSQNCVVISDADLLREAFAKNVFSDRPEMYLFSLGRDPREPESKGIIMNDGDSWKQQRRFTLHTFRNFGVGKTSFENVIADECERLVERISAKKEKEFDIRMLLNSAIADVISTVLFGKDFQHSDSEFARYVDHVANAAENLGGSAIMNVFPWTKNFPFFSGIFDKLIKGRDFTFAFLQAIVDREKKNFDEKDIGSYTAAYLAKQKAEDGQLFTDHHLIMTLSDIFGAGFETTATTLRWAILYMCLRPDLQKKIQEELDNKIDRGRQPRISDRENLPWTEATLLEVQRIASIAPLGVPHAVSEDTELAGFAISKKTMIFPNIFFIHHDPKNFPDPEEFKPERFLDEKFSRIVGTENLMPFSTGKRFCPGESLAKMELTLFFSVLLQNFTFQFPQDHSPDLRPRCGLTNDTRPFLLIATPRDKSF